MDNDYDIIIIGGSYAGLAAAMTLGRASMKTLVIDDNKPCNRQTPYSHNFITNDGRTPADIAASARKQVSEYPTVSFLQDTAIQGFSFPNRFSITTANKKQLSASKLIFATGIKDELPLIEHVEACWGISVLHCPYCHGYEVRNQKTGIVANGATAFDLARLISNWTPYLTLFTNGPSTLTHEQSQLISSRNIPIVQSSIRSVNHVNGVLQSLVLDDGSSIELNVLYTQTFFVQHSNIPASLGCEVNTSGYIVVNDLFETTVSGIYAIGDAISKTRTVANAVATGTAAGIAVSKQIIFERF